MSANSAGKGRDEDRSMTVNMSCGDVIPGCAAVFEAGTESELLDQIAEHAEADHAITEIDPATLDAVRSAIRTTD